MNKKLNKKVVPFLILAQIMTTSGLSYAAPKEIHAFTTMKKWDYHKTNYDKDGNIRYKPKSVQFDTENEGVIQVDNRIPKLNSEDTEYGQNVEITFDSSTAEAKQWQSNIYRIVKQNSYTNDPNSVQDVVYKIEDGKITLYADSRAIDSNGEHLIKIYSTGYDTVKGVIHIVKEGKIRIHGDFNPIEGEDLLFELLDFNYAVTNPIYEVLLDGDRLEGDCNDYHVVSNLIRLENDAHSKLTKGKHTITVKAKGYKDFNKTFIVEESKGKHINPVTNHNQEIKRLVSPIKNKVAKIDTISSASTEPGGNSDTGSGGSGSLDTQANLVFDFDLVSNAQILKELGMETENSRKVLEIWDSATKDAVSKDEKMLTWAGFANAVMDAKVKGKHITFEDYMKSPDAEEYKNRPYNVKYVLEDGLYGQAQSFSQINKKQAPKIGVLKSKLGQDVELTFDDNEWENNIESIKVGSTQLLDREYEVKDNKIIVTGNRFTTGNNEVIIVSKGYKDAVVNVLVEKSSINLSIDPDTNKIEKNINVLGITEDFAKNIQTVTLNGKVLLSQEALGLGDWDYKVQSNKIVLNKDLFKNENKQTLIIKSYGYKEKMMQFTLEKGNAVIDPINDIVPTAKTTQGILGEDVVITWKNDNPKWREAVTQVYVGNMMVSGDKYSLDKGKITIKSSVFRKGSNKVVIKSEKYTDLDITQDMIANTPKLTIKESNTTNGIKISVPANQFGWIDSIIEVKVDDITIDTQKYKKESLSIVIDNEIISKEKDYKIEVLANGYKKAEFNVVVKDSTKPFKGTKKSAITLNASQENKLGKDVEITFIDNQEFRTSIKEVLINNVKIEEDKVKISKDKIVINKDVFKQANTYNIKIIANGYEDTQISQKISEEINTEKPGKLLTPPSLDNIDYIKKTQNLIINASDWTNAIKTIVVNGNTLTKGADYYTDFSNADFVIKGFVFNTTGEKTIVFRADGYKELTIKVIVQNAKEVPAEVRLKGDSEISTGNDVVIDLSQVPFEMNGYNVEEVYLGAEKLTGDTKVKISFVNVIVKGKNFAKSGNYKIILKANGYEDKEFNITVKEADTASENLNKDTEKPVITLNGDASITLENGATYNDAGVTIKDNKDENLTETVKYTKDGGSVSGIDTSVAGTYTIHYNVSDKAGNEADEVTRTVTVNEAVAQELKDAPVIKDQEIPFINSDISFKIENRDEKWESKITEFIFEGTSYSKGENYKIEEQGMFTKTWYFIVGNSLFPSDSMHYIDNGTYNITIKSDGYKDISFSVKIGN